MPSSILDLIGRDSWSTPSTAVLDRLGFVKAKIALTQQIRQRVEDRLLEALTALGDAEAAHRGYPELVSYHSERTRERVRHWAMRRAAGEDWPTAPAATALDADVMPTLTPDTLQCASCGRQASIASWQRRGCCPACGGPGYMPTGTRSRPAAPATPTGGAKPSALTELRRVALQSVADMTAAELEMAGREERKNRQLDLVRVIFEELRANTQQAEGLSQERDRLQRELFQVMPMGDGVRLLEDERETADLTMMEDNDVPNLI